MAKFVELTMNGYKNLINTNSIEGIRKKNDVCELFLTSEEIVCIEEPYEEVKKLLGVE